MLALPTNVRGMLLMVGASGLLNVQLSMVGKLVESGWPDFPMLSLTLSLQVPCVLAWLCFSRPSLPKLQDLKWLFLAGFFFAGSFVLMVLSVGMGIPIGDFAALNSANVVFAAFLGRMFLNEQLHWLHCVAVLSSISGAVLIAKPAMIFGGGEVNDSTWIGYALALGSGLCDAGIYISMRKTGNCSPAFAMLAFVVAGSVTMLACIPLALGSMQDAFHPLALAPAEASGWIAGLFAFGSVSLVMFALAAQICPASVSATVDTATRMTSGYAAQVILFGASLDPLTISGAVLMFASVATMALLQAPAVPSEPSEESVEIESNKPAQTEDEATTNDDEELESLASFVASEFAGSASHPVALRMRRFAAGSADLSARTIGALTLASAVPASA